jgi:hypothetical protein
MLYTRIDVGPNALARPFSWLEETKWYDRLSFVSYAQQQAFSSDRNQTLWLNHP